MKRGHTTDAGAGISRADACRLMRATSELAGLFEEACRVRLARTGDVITYSPKIFIPLTNLWLDRSGYSTFAHIPGDGLAAHHDCRGSAGRSACWQ